MHCGMARLKLRCIMGCPGLKSRAGKRSIYYKNLLFNFFDVLKNYLPNFVQFVAKIGFPILFDLFQKSFFQLYLIYYRNHLVKFV